MAEGGTHGAGGRHGTPKTASAAGTRRAGAAGGYETWRFSPSASHAGGTGGATRTASGRKRAGRARQFLPFAALRGYYELIREQERIPEPKRELPEEEALRLSALVARLRKGDLVRVTHYDGDAYTATEGMVSQVDTTFKTLSVVKRRIAFDAILDIELLSAQDGRLPRPRRAGDRSSGEPALQPKALARTRP